MARLQRCSVGLEGCWKAWTQGRVSCLYQRGLDRHAASQSSKEDGGASHEPASATAFFRSERTQGASLVERLCDGDHFIEVGLRPEKTMQLFKEAIDRNYVHIKFTQTRGGTELGFHLDRDSSISEMRISMREREPFTAKAI